MAFEGRPAAQGYPSRIHSGFLSIQSVDLSGGKPRSGRQRYPTQVVMRIASSRLVRLKLAAPTGEIIAHNQATDQKANLQRTIRFAIRKKNARRCARRGFCRSHPDIAQMNRGWQVRQPLENDLLQIRQPPWPAFPGLMPVSTPAWS